MEMMRYGVAEVLIPKENNIIKKIIKKAAILMGCYSSKLELLSKKLDTIYKVC